ncbi:response regulator [Candidatus Reidiella endopervernicosa]|uniref:response regulator n=1 Tax=Candidatus Reidiella endopervernicosa TaxID=2738883 RepID=UPI001F01E66E|nr:response regulator [Candidatus Reidiella endopervernicosa]
MRAATHPRPDIILLDIVMPGLDGFHICELLQADPNTVDIPIIFITASSSETDEVRGLALGGRDFISKPVRPEIVRARVKSQIIQLMQKRAQAYASTTARIIQYRRSHQHL